MYKLITLLVLFSFITGCSPEFNFADSPNNENEKSETPTDEVTPPENEEETLPPNPPIGAIQSNLYSVIKPNSIGELIGIIKPEGTIINGLASNINYPNIGSLNLRLTHSEEHTIVKVIATDKSLNKNLFLNFHCETSNNLVSCESQLFLISPLAPNEDRLCGTNKEIQLLIEFSNQVINEYNFEIENCKIKDLLN